MGGGGGGEVMLVIGGGLGEKRMKEETGGQKPRQTSTPEINTPSVERLGGETRAQQSRLVGSSFAIGSVVVVPRCRTGRPVVWG